MPFPFDLFLEFAGQRGLVGRCSGMSNEKKAGSSISPTLRTSVGRASRPCFSCKISSISCGVFGFNFGRSGLCFGGSGFCAGASGLSCGGSGLRGDVVRSARLLFDDAAAADESESVRDVSRRWDRGFPSGVPSLRGGVLTLLASYSHS